MHNNEKETTKENGRVLKFRAWDKKQNEMVTDILSMEVGFESHGNLYCREGEYRNIDDCILMQYTGLKDKNGKEIYEGDIIKLKEDRGIEVVRYHDGGFQLFQPTNDEYMESESDYLLTHSWVDSFQYEIIGNIYENPGLLIN